MSNINCRKSSTLELIGRKCNFPSFSLKFQHLIKTLVCMHREEVKTKLRQKIQAFFENEDEIERIPIENLKQVSNSCHYLITFGRWMLIKST